MNNIRVFIKQALILDEELSNLPGVDKRTEQNPNLAISLLDRVVTDPELYKAVSELFNNGHHAQAVEKAYKFLVKIVKQKAGNNSDDGASLMRSVFSPKNPVLQLNSLANRSEQDEQLGYMDIMAGVMTGVRNPRAHEHDWEDTEERALQLLSLANHLVLRVRQAQKTTP